MKNTKRVELVKKEAVSYETRKEVKKDRKSGTYRGIQTRKQGGMIHV